VRGRVVASVIFSAAREVVFSEKGPPLRRSVIFFPLSRVFLPLRSPQPVGVYLLPLPARPVSCFFSIDKERKVSFLEVVESPPLPDGGEGRSLPFPSAALPTRGGEVDFLCGGECEDIIVSDFLHPS